MAAQTFSAKEVAAELDTDPRTLRKFLREVIPADEHPGQGGRWVLGKADVNKLKKQFAGWGSKPKSEESDGEAKPKRASKRAKQVEAEEIEDEVVDLEAEEDLDFTDLEDPDLDDLDDLEEDEDEDE